MFNKVFFICALLFIGYPAFAQECSIVISGYVMDSETGKPLDDVHIFIEENGAGSETDLQGYFEIPPLCPDSYHLILSHIGCASKEIFIKLRRDTTMHIEMDHTITELSSVIISGSSKQESTEKRETITEQNISDNADNNLSDILESISGVRSLRNGNGIAKPMVHGMFGNRLTMLNNGVSQSGQRWGNDHSPEIDPLVANKISVIKGTGALAYPGAALGGVILVEPSKIGREPHLHGKAGYYYTTNGRGHGLHVQMRQYTPKIGWKINGTLKRGGDQKSADYFLNNTGNQEANFALQLEKSLSDKWFLDLYASTFNTTIGVLRGSHIGNLTDLESALSQETPFFTETEFDYTIDAPRQEVNHHLVKLHSKYFFDDSQWFDISIATQFNNRKEFDVRRSGRENIAALSLEQVAIFGEAKFQKEYDNDWILKSGIQLNATDNTNNPETGILPLIPDYRLFETGVFATFSKKLPQSFIDFGIRYNQTTQNVKSISNTTPRTIIEYDDKFNNLSASAGYSLFLGQRYSITTNLGYTSRNPAINELYSNGLHQGVSGIEEGSISLKSEHAIKSTLDLKANITDAISFETLLYFQSINDYIFLQPEDEIRLTIRGAFPVFKYTQTDARIYGLDLKGGIKFSSSISSEIRYSYLRGDDTDADIPLVNMPANNLYGALTFNAAHPFEGSKLHFENLEFTINANYVARQDHLLASQDFVTPPDAYFLIGAQLSTDIQIKKSRIRFTAKGENLLNIQYRDYLNRLRSFADELGRNITLGITLKF